MHYHTPFKRFAVALVLASAFAALAPAPRPVIAGDPGTATGMTPQRSS